MDRGRTTSNATYGNFYRNYPTTTTRQRHRPGNLLSALSTDPDDLPYEDALWDLEDYYERNSSRPNVYNSNGFNPTSTASTLAPLGDPPSSWPENIHSFGYGYENPFATGYYSDSTPRHYTDLTRPIELDSDGPSTLIAPSLPFVAGFAQPTKFTFPQPTLLSDRGQSVSQTQVTGVPSFSNPIKATFALQFGSLNRTQY